MSTVSEQLQAIRNDQQSLRTRIIALTPSDILYSALGEYVVFGCKVTEGDDDGDMVVALEGQAAGDEAMHNPDVSATPTRGFEYPNRASLKDGAFTSPDMIATVEDPPGTGLGRYDVAYIYVGPNGAGFAIATGTPSEDVKTAFDTYGLDADAYLHTASYDPDLPIGALPVARIYVEDDVVGIANARIADIRPDIPNVGLAQMTALLEQAEAARDQAQASAIAAGNSETAAGGFASDANDSAVAAEQWASMPEDEPVPAAGSDTEYSALHYAVKAAGFAGLAAASEGAAGGSAADAGDFAIEAEQWASMPEDEPVPAAGSDTEFSAKHYAAKAAASVDDINTIDLLNWLGV